MKEEAERLSSLSKRSNWKKLDKTLNQMSKTIEEENDARETFKLVEEHLGSNILHFLFRKIAPISIVLKIIQLFPHLASEVDSDGISPLHTAAACGLPPIFIRALLSICPETALKKDKFGRTPLIAACQSLSSGLDVDSPYTIPGVEFSVDFWIHHQIVLALLSVPLNGIALVDLFGLNALDYTIQGNGPLSVVQLLQAHLAFEKQIIHQLQNTTKRTRLPKLPMEQHQPLMISSPWSIPSLRKSFGDEDSVLCAATANQGWRPIMYTNRNTQKHNKNRLGIYERMKRIRLDCDSASENNVHYMRGLKSFIGAKDCDDSIMNDDSVEFVFNPFDIDIPLVIDVIIEPNDYEVEENGLADETG